MDLILRQWKRYVHARGPRRDAKLDDLLRQSLPASFEKGTTIVNLLLQWLIPVGSTSALQMSMRLLPVTDAQGLSTLSVTVSKRQDLTGHEFAWSNEHHPAL